MKYISTPPLEGDRDQRGCILIALLTHSKLFEGLSSLTENDSWGSGLISIWKQEHHMRWSHVHDEMVMSSVDPNREEEDRSHRAQVAVQHENTTVAVRSA